MHTDIIISFLSAGLINVGGDDAKLEKLKEAAADLATILKKNPSKATPFALVAFDPEIPVTDPVIREVAEVLQKRWATYVNTFSSTPITVFRSMLLASIVQASADDDKIGVAFVTSARNTLPFMEIGDESAIWSNAINEVEQRLDIRAESEWATPFSISVPTMLFSAPAAVKIETTGTSLKKEWLTQKVDAAVGPSNAAGVATNGTQVWPNQGSTWAQQFAPKLSELLYDSFATIAKGVSTAPLDLAEPFNQIAQAVSTHVDNTLRSVSNATAGLQRRTNLIWWKETLYSPSARTSYRGITAPAAAALMALDLHQQVPTFSPASVAAFLHETVLSLPSLDAKEEKPLRDYLDKTLSTRELAPLREIAAQIVPERPGRGPLIGLLGHGAGQSLQDPQVFRNRVGVPAETSLTVPDWATWLFRELQAARATYEPSEAKKKVRKS